MPISIVIPAYNEEQRLPATLESLCSYLQRVGWDRAEVLVVDDGSTDGTVAAVQAFQTVHPEIDLKLLHNPGNRGKGYSVRHGMLKASGDWILFTDADLSAPIEEAGKLLAAADSTGAAIAIGSRALNRSLIAIRQSIFREYAGRIFNSLMHAVVGLPFWDTQCGFKLFRADAAKSIFGLQRIERFGFDVEALFLAQKLGFKAVEVPVRWSHAEGTRVSMFRDSLGMFIDLMRVRSYNRRGLYTAVPAAAEQTEHVLR